MLKIIPLSEPILALPKVLLQFDAPNDNGVRTCSTPDGTRPYETFVKHPEYHAEIAMSVEAYETEEEAKAGHDRWVEMYQQDTLPATIEETCNSPIARMVLTPNGGDKSNFTHTRGAAPNKNEQAVKELIEASRDKSLLEDLLNRAMGVSNAVEGDSCPCEACNIRRQIFGADPNEDAMKGMQSAGDIALSANRVLH